MKNLLVFLEAYLRLIGHDAFMSRHDLAALHKQIRDFPRRPATMCGQETELVCSALDAACAIYPRQVLCLQRSTVLVKMLRRRGAPAHMIIGAQKLPFKAHAWVEIDGAIIGDRLASRERFLVLEVC